MVSMCIAIDIDEINWMWGSDCSIIARTPDDFYVVDNVKQIDYPIDKVKTCLENAYSVKAKCITTDGLHIFLILYDKIR